MYVCMYVYIYTYTHTHTHTHTQAFGYMKRCWKMHHWWVVVATGWAKHGIRRTTDWTVIRCFHRAITEKRKFPEIWGPARFGKKMDWKSKSQTGNKIGKGCKWQIFT